MVGAQRPLPSRCLQNADHAATFLKAGLWPQPLQERAVDLALQIAQELRSGMELHFTIEELLQWHKVKNLHWLYKRAIVAGIVDILCRPRPNCWIVKVRGAGKKTKKNFNIKKQKKTQNKPHLRVCTVMHSCTAWLTGELGCAG